MKKLSVEQIAIVLDAITLVEGWDAEHDSVAADADGGWKFVRGLPKPSRKLLREVRRVEALAEVNRRMAREWKEESK